MGAKFQIKYLYNILTPSLMKLPFTSFFIYIIFIACRPSMKLEETDTDFDFEKIKVSMEFIDELFIGISFFGRAWSELNLLEIGYAYEQSTNIEKQLNL